MTAHITKTWFDGEKIVTQNIPESEIYKPEWVGLTQGDIDKAWEWAQKSSPHGVTRIETFAINIETRLRKKIMAKLIDFPLGIHEGALKLIKQILTKHDAAIIEASQEAIETAVLAEREACAKVCDEIVARYRHADDAPEMVAANWCAQAIRARGSV